MRSVALVTHVLLLQEKPVLAHVAETEPPPAGLNCGHCGTAANDRRHACLVARQLAEVGGGRGDGRTGWRMPWETWCDDPSKYLGSRCRGSPALWRPPPQENCEAQLQLRRGAARNLHLQSGKARATLWRCTVIIRKEKLPYRSAKQGGPPAHPTQ
ncbi:hypothetical protein QBC33DRAFT_10276 [Phialemonium atrogriseum]|uniref:Secreted protein n=1 Tax=Phialemonium atrogriseum TaxID=1093897 RepID=A0AAJ0C9H0_9PEZI|nr:uncharacterized protein QBC33DRAFT_10276 [Phialemonium atrogriseum]KAK1772441.1 hypothetical protein QBC33DRAFT_10276 [Phialemonium atrogriseum]